QEGGDGRGGDDPPTLVGALARHEVVDILGDLLVQVVLFDEGQEEHRPVGPEAGVAVGAAGVVGVGRRAPGGLGPQGGDHNGRREALVDVVVVVGGDAELLEVV